MQKSYSKTSIKSVFDEGPKHRCVTPGDEEDLSPTEILRVNWFPLKDFELLRVFEVYVKIEELLQSFINNMDQVKKQAREPAGTEEFFKVKRRGTEFSVRYSRNNVYPFRSQVHAIEAFIHTGKAYLKSNKTILQKNLQAVYQSCQQCLQTYATYISSPNNIHLPNKLEEVVKLVKQLNEATSSLLVPIMGTLGRGKDQFLSLSCEKLLEILKAQQEVKPSIKKAKKKLDVNLRRRQLPLFEGKLYPWKKKAETLARLRQQKAAKKSKMIESSSVIIEKDRGPISVSRKDIVTSPDPDLETQIERFRLHDAKTQENIQIHCQDKYQPSHSTSQEIELREILKSALDELKPGNENSVLNRLKNLNLTSSENVQKPNEKPEQKQALRKSNVEIICIRSDSYDKEELPRGTQYVAEENESSRLKEHEECEECLRLNQLDSSKHGTNSKIEPEKHKRVTYPTKTRSHKNRRRTVSKPISKVPSLLLSPDISEEDSDVDTNKALTNRSTLLGFQSERAESYSSDRSAKLSSHRLFLPVIGDVSPNKTNLTPIAMSEDRQEMYLRCKRKIDSGLNKFGTVKPWDTISRLSDALIDDLLTQNLPELVDEQSLARLFENEIQ